jgi:hypothetical protein
LSERGDTVIGIEENHPHNPAVVWDAIKISFRPNRQIWDTVVVLKDGTSTYKHLLYKHARGKWEEEEEGDVQGRRCQPLLDRT